MLIRRILQITSIFFCFTVISHATIDTVEFCGTEQSTDNVGQLTGTTWTLKVLLVEFQDIKAHSPLYSISDFEKMFFSNGTYVSPNEYSPDGEEVFGSMRDYLSIMSNGDFTVTGYVLNDDQGDGTPEWLTLPHTKSYYDNRAYTYFVNDALSAASTAGLNTTINGTTKLAFIYAGNAYRCESCSTKNGLIPRAWVIDNYYINSVLFEEGAPFQSEHQNAKFSEIGINVHEFLHLLGLNDVRINGFFDVMGAGNFCGPNSRGACPAPINPVDRYKKGWLNPTPIYTDHNTQVDYDLDTPEVFKFVFSAYNYMFIETRDFTSTMTIGTTVTDDYNSWIHKTFYSSYPDQGVMVWRVVNSSDHGTLLQADGIPLPSYPQISFGTTFPGSGNIMVFSPWSDSRTPPPNWIPNTYPATHAGFEIVGEGSGWYSLDLYVSSPEDASPSKPYNIGLTWQSNHPKITWDANSEPDLDHYEVYKKSGGSFSYYASTTNTYYVDNSEMQYSHGHTKTYVYYEIKAVDDEDKGSVFSDDVKAAVNETQGSKRRSEDENLIGMLAEYKLSTNYPNPFNPNTAIEYQLVKDSYVALSVYNMLGEEVAELVNEFEEAGYYSIQFDGSNLPSGMYIYKIQAGEFSDVKKMLLLK